MQVAADDLRRIERLHVRAWPAFETADIHGWLWRYSGGGSQRANSVSTVDFSGGDPATALDEVEARYRARNAIVRVHTYDLSAPADIVDLLQRRGYGAGETTLTTGKGCGGFRSLRGCRGRRYSERPMARGLSRRAQRKPSQRQCPDSRRGAAALRLFFLPARRTGHIDRIVRRRWRLCDRRMHGDARRGAAAGRCGRRASQP
jgi:hypothetical protein